MASHIPHSTSPTITMYSARDSISTPDPDPGRGTRIASQVLSCSPVILFLLVIGFVRLLHNIRARCQVHRRRSTSTATTIPDDIIDMPELRFPPAAYIADTRQTRSRHVSLEPSSRPLSSIQEEDIAPRFETPPPSYTPPPPGYEEIYEDMNRS